MALGTSVARKNTYQRHQSLHATRVDWSNINDRYISESARTKLVSEVEQAVTNFLQNNPSIVNDAQREHLRIEMEKAEPKYAEAVAAADEALKRRRKHSNPSYGRQHVHPGAS